MIGDESMLVYWIIVNAYIRVLTVDKSDFYSICFYLAQWQLNFCQSQSVECLPPQKFLHLHELSFFNGIQSFLPAKSASRLFVC